MLGVGAAAAYIPVSQKEIVTTEPGKDYEKLYEIFESREPVEIGGIKFYIADFEQNIHSQPTLNGGEMPTGQNLRLTLEANLPI